MKLITKEGILKNLISRYKQQYPNNMIVIGGRWSDDIIRELELEKPLTEERANEIIGNSSWTRIRCDECNKEVQSVVMVDEEPDCESSTAMLCVSCLKKAIKLSIKSKS